METIGHRRSKVYLKEGIVKDERRTTEEEKGEKKQTRKSKNTNQSRKPKAKPGRRNSVGSLPLRSSSDTGFGKAPRKWTGCRWTPLCSHLRHLETEARCPRLLTLLSVRQSPQADTCDQKHNVSLSFPLLGHAVPSITHIRGRIFFSYKPATRLDNCCIVLEKRLKL
jgi:hypothetical protein